MGFWICDFCGYGSPRVNSPQKWPKHNHLLKNQSCAGNQRPLDLGHVYETDLLSFNADISGIRATHAAWLSVMYAIVEAASEILEISRDDIGGSLTPVGENHWSITLFDAVPGGAGHVLHVEENLEQVLNAALERVGECECGPETSCYGCLRSYQNQRDHDFLSRGAAEQLLRRLVKDEGSLDESLLLQQEPIEIPGSLPRDWTEIYVSAFVSERELLLALAEAGAPRPELGFESAGGIPITLAWPDRLIAVDYGFEAQDRLDLQGEGWKVLPIDRLARALEG